jgi:hypothetical protein
MSVHFERSSRDCTCWILISLLVNPVILPASLQCQDRSVLANHDAVIATSLFLVVTYVTSSPSNDKQVKGQWPRDRNDDC